VVIKAPEGFANYLDVVHHSRHLAGLHGFYDHHAAELPHLSTIYRLHQRVRDDLLIFPMIDLGALGLVHLHLFINDASHDWSSFAYGVESCWLTTIAGPPVLYVHAVVPQRDAETVASSLRSQQVIVAVTEDSWQLFNAGLLGARATRDEMLTPPMRSAGPLVPLIVPIAFESFGRRHSLKELWQQITAHVGAQVWEYLPRRRRRDGIRHVTDALDDARHLFRQNVIRYAPLLADHVEIFIATTLPEAGMLTEWCHQLRDSCPIVEAALGPNGACVLRVTGKAHVIGRLSALQLPGRAYLRDPTRTPTQPRFQYEHLFDPKTCSWQEAPHGQSTHKTTTTDQPTTQAPARADRQTRSRPATTTRVTG
jgi:hypothetical protein